ncbi:hypothetical protein [Synechococcus sp. PCC 7336]|nr:hypothetical protein [Synechococcus sp. PCC 7336]
MTIALLGLAQVPAIETDRISHSSESYGEASALATSYRSEAF